MSSHVFDKSAWAELDMFNQMGNISSEVGRAFTAKRLGNTERMQGALSRGLDLIDITASLWSEKKSPRVRELLIARELFARSITTDDIDDSLEPYFMQYAMAARLNK